LSTAKVCGVAAIAARPAPALLQRIKRKQAHRKNTYMRQQNLNKFLNKI